MANTILASKQAAAGNSCERQRDQDVIAGERNAEKAPCRLIAGYDMDGVQLIEQRSAAVEMDERPRAIARPVPEAPFDAGVIGAERRAAQRADKQRDQAGGDEQARRLRPRGQRQQERKRDDNIIRDALDEAEMAGLVAEHELEIPGARKRREAEHEHAERRPRERT